MAFKTDQERKFAGAEWKIASGLEMGQVRRGACPTTQSMLVVKVLLFAGIIFWTYSFIDRKQSVS